MPTHAHGQRYTDLNFLLSELVQRIEYRKGPYFADSGNFASAGAADIVYRTRLEAPFASVTLGENGCRRGVRAASADAAPGISLLGAVELMRNDGPWTVPEDLQRTNAVLTLSSGTAAQGFSTSLTSSAWASPTAAAPRRAKACTASPGGPHGPRARSSAPFSRPCSAWPRGQ